MPSNRFNRPNDIDARRRRGNMMVEGDLERINRWRPTFRLLADLTAPANDDALDPLLKRLGEASGKLDRRSARGVR